MSTKIRHNRLTGAILISVADLLKKKEALALHEECSLVHWGYWNKPEPILLVDINNIENMDIFMEKIIDDLDYVQPDFFIFHKNLYITNKRETRIAGRPDLIVEVWSESNRRDERNFKFDLYSSSSDTEHWYIEQDSNDVQCYMGKEQLPEQYLTNVLGTQSGLEFDLRYLAI